ncbi:MAG: DUF4738 domain-containing protein [Prevotella sp.]|nr:DUF4738 domain-containing protein [Prevotella sp.]
MYRIALILFLSLVVTVSCKKKEQTDDIIIEKVVEKPQDGPESMASSEQSGSVTWIKGAEYSYTIKRYADSNLSQVTNHDTKYCDNSVTLTVNRADGSVFFEKTFSKSNFAPVLPKDFIEHGVLLGMNFDKVDGNDLLFVVSVGSPDETNEEFYYVQMRLSNMGATSAERINGAE